MQSEIVILNQDSGYLMIDIANAFAVENRKCTLIAGRLVQRNTALSSEVKFRKIVRYERRNIIKRLFTWGMGFLQMLLLVFVHHRSAHLLIVSNPPFAPLLPLLLRNKFSLLIFDVYPDALWEFKILPETSWFVRLWKKANQRLYRRAEQIFTITEGMKQVLEFYCDADRQPIKVVPIWTDNHFLKPIPKKSNPFIRQHGLNNFFTVLYSGNLGFSHNIETIVELAAIVHQPDILFLIIGDGDRKQMVAEKIRFYGLKNCRLLPFQPPEMLPYSLSTADIAIVSQGNRAARLSIPSKTFNLMSVGAPLLCIADRFSELTDLVEKFDIGASFSIDQLEDMKRFVIDLANNPRQCQHYRKNALKASLKFTGKNTSLITSAFSPEYCPKKTNS